MWKEFKNGLMQLWYRDSYVVWGIIFLIIVIICINLK